MAHQMGLKANEIIKVLLGLASGSINQSLDIDTATLVAAEFDYEVEKPVFGRGLSCAAGNRCPGKPEKQAARCTPLRGP